jgi:hypothetical protein
LSHVVSLLPSPRVHPCPQSLFTMHSQNKSLKTKATSGSMSFHLTREQKPKFSPWPEVTWPEHHLGRVSYSVPLVPSAPDTVAIACPWTWHDVSFQNLCAGWSPCLERPSLVTCRTTLPKVCQVFAGMVPSRGLPWPVDLK